jgi:hypothetical protein
MVENIELPPEVPTVAELLFGAPAPPAPTVIV